MVGLRNRYLLMTLVPMSSCRVIQTCQLLLVKVCIPSVSFKDYLQQGAASIVQVDVARIGGITPWLKVAHMAEAHNILVCPHFLMELHLSLVCAVAQCQMAGIHSTARHDYEPINEDEGRIRDAFGNTGIGY